MSQPALGKKQGERAARSPSVLIRSTMCMSTDYISTAAAWTSGAQPPPSPPSPPSAKLTKVPPSVSNLRPNLRPCFTSFHVSSSDLWHHFNCGPFILCPASLLPVGTWSYDHHTLINHLKAFLASHRPCSANVTITSQCSLEAKQSSSWREKLPHSEWWAKPNIETMYLCCVLCGSQEINNYVVWICV